MYLNSQSIVNKIEELITTTNDLTPDIICICETWCHAGKDNSFLNIPGYKLIEDLRKDTVNICLVYRSPNSSNVNNTDLNSLLLSL